MNCFVKLSVLFLLPVTLMVGCGKLVSEPEEIPGMGVVEEGRAEVTLNVCAPGGAATKGTASAKEKYISKMSMLVFFEDGTLDFMENLSSSQIGALSSSGSVSISAKLSIGTNIIWFLANMDVTGISKEDDLLAMTVHLPSSPTGFAMSARQEVTVAYSGEEVNAVFALKRLASKVRLNKITNGTSWPVSSSVNFIAAYLCNAATEYSVGGPASNPMWVHQEGLRNHDLNNMIGRDPSSEASGMVRKYYENDSNFQALYDLGDEEDLDSSRLFNDVVETAMSSWTAYTHRGSQTVSFSIDLSSYRLSPPIGGGGGMGSGMPGVDEYYFTYTCAEGLYSSGLVGSEFMYYPESSFINGKRYPCSDSMMHVFKKDCAINSGESVVIDKEFYCMPNPLTNPNAGYHSTFVPTSTVLMVVASIGAEKYYYPIPLNSAQGLGPNEECVVSVVLTDVGNSASNWFDPVQPKVNVGFVIDVKPWESGGSYSELL